MPTTHNTSRWLSDVTADIKNGGTLPCGAGDDRTKGTKRRSCQVHAPSGVKPRIVKRRKCWIFIPPFRPPGTFPRKRGKESFVPSDVNTGLAKRRRYWLRFKRRKYWIFPPSALQAPAPASGEGIFHAKRRGYGASHLSGVNAGFLSPLPPSGHLPPQAGEGIFRAKRRKY